MSPLPTTMTVARFLGEGRLDREERPVPEPGPGQLLLRVTANAMCGTDRHQLHTGSVVTPGHEVAGEVVATGSGSSTASGTAGVAFLMDFCGDCRSCRVGATNQCYAKRADLGFTVDGGYAPYTVVSESAFFPTPGIAGPQATLLLDVMGTGGHALRRARAVRDDIASVLVMGAGPIGIAALVMTKLLLGDDVPVAVAELSPYRLKLAEELGAVPVDLAGGELARGLAESGFPAPDLAVDSTGKAPARTAALDALDKRGVLVCVGHGGELPLTVTPQLIMPERSVLGSEYFRYDEMADNLALLRERGDRLAPVITHRFPLTEIEEAFALFLAGEAGKVVITP